MNVKDILRRCNMVYTLRILADHLQKVAFFSRHLANRAKRDNLKDMLPDLSIRVHAIEKGMSIGAVRIGFGVPKVMALLDDLQTWLNLGGSREFAVASCSVINNYIDFNIRGGGINDVKIKLDAFIERNGITLLPQGGVYTITHARVSEDAQGAFPLLSQSRYAVRDFGEAPIDLEKIRKALKLCERTPSACNRQSWRVHIYTQKEKKNRLFELQGGCKGFHDGMQVAVLLCADASSYAFPEMPTAYIDGGIYAMNLMYALAYYDLASIPLTLAIGERRLRAMKREMGVPQREIPVLLIGVGTFKDTFRVAQSQRAPFTDYVIFEE